MVNYRSAGNALRVLLPLAVIYSCGAVATRTKFHEPIAEELRSGNYDLAVNGIEAARAKGKYGEKDRLLYYLDSGMINHYAEYFDTSNVKLSSAEDAADELYTKSVSRAAASMVLNDNIMEYSGEDHEILYTNLIMALNYISLDKFDDAFVEIRRANEKLELLEQKYALAAEEYNSAAGDDEESVKIDYEAAEIRFNNDAFARYLSMKIYAAEGKMDDARIDYDWLLSAFETQPHIYDFDPPDVKMAADGGALLSVVGLTGLAPVKEALNLRIRTDKDLDLVQVLYTDSERKDVEYGHLPIPVSADYYFKFAIPKLVPRASLVSRIEILINGKPIGELQLIEDISRVASETFKAKSSLIYLRTVARAVAKGLAAHKLKVKADTGGLEGWLKKAAVDVATDLSENADLRCARYLPGKIFVGDFEIEPGVYDLGIRIIDWDGAEIEHIFIPEYRIKRQELNLVEAICLQ